MTRSITGLIALLMVVACGGTSPTTVVPTASNVSVQPADLPAGMVRCDLSGDIDTYLTNIQTKDPATYTSTKNQWEAAQAKGATEAQVVFYTDSAANCASVESKVSNISSATYKLVVNFVIQFKDEATAATDYTNEKIFGIDRTALGANGAPVIEGTKTGLGPNSIVLSVPIASQSFYIAVWQAKAFMVILGIINLDSATGQKVADAEFKRIH
jgi:hypothetical protein